VNTFVTRLEQRAGNIVLTPAPDICPPAIMYQPRRNPCVSSLLEGLVLVGGVDQRSAEPKPSLPPISTCSKESMGTLSVPHRRRQVQDRLQDKTRQGKKRLGWAGQLTEGPAMDGWPRQAWCARVSK
jgi:hypothetical protein